MSREYKHIKPGYRATLKKDPKRLGQYLEDFIEFCDREGILVDMSVNRDLILLSAEILRDKQPQTPISTNPLP